MSSRQQYDPRDRGEPRYPPQAASGGPGGRRGNNDHGPGPARTNSQRDPQQQQRPPRGQPQRSNSRNNNDTDNNNDNTLASSTGRDRLNDFRAGSAQSGQSGYSNASYSSTQPMNNNTRNPYPSNSRGGGTGGRAGGGSAAGAGGGGGGSGRFYDDVDQVRGDLDRIQRQLLPDLTALQQRIITSTHQSETDKLTSQMNGVQDNITNTLQQCRRIVKKLSADNANMQAGTAEAHSRKGQLGTLAKKLMNVADEIQGVQRSFRTKYKQRMEREIKIARPDATPQEIARALDSNSGSAFSQQLLSSRNEKSRRALEDVQDRHTELQKIERSMTELFELFQEMQALLEAQQEMINNVESNVENTVAYMEEGSKELTKAVGHRKNTRKRTWWIILIVVILLIIIGVAVYIEVIKPLISKNN